MRGFSHSSVIYINAGAIKFEKQELNTRVHQQRVERKRSSEDAEDFKIWKRSGRAVSAKSRENFATSLFERKTTLKPEVETSSSSQKPRVYPLEQQPVPTGFSAFRRKLMTSLTGRYFGILDGILILESIVSLSRFCLESLSVVSNCVTSFSREFPVNHTSWLALTSFTNFWRACTRVRYFFIFVYLFIRRFADRSRILPRRKV